MQWNENGTITVDPPKRPKKITGTRLAAIFGANEYKSPFATWCEITRTYEDPFVESKYTLAGKTIEPKQAEYIKSWSGMDIVSPSDIYGSDYFEKTRGDFFPDQGVFGGMWDYLLKENGKVSAVFEMKTTKRAEDWDDGRIPLHYAYQAALYAYLLGVDNVVMVCSLLTEPDYEHPEEYVPSSSNTFIRSFKVSEKFPQMDAVIAEAVKWWDGYVLTGQSPQYDEKKDAAILKELRRNNLSPDTDIKELLDEAEALQAEIDKVSAEISEKEKRLKVLKEMIKEFAIKGFRDGDKEVTLRGSRWDWTVSKTMTASIDKDAMKKDGVLDKYSKKTESYRLTTKEVQDVH